MIDLVRKYVSYEEEILIEGGKTAPTPLRLMAVAAVIKNPWAGQGFVEDLKPVILRYASSLGQTLTQKITAMTKGEEAIQAYGKASIVGGNGEIEHGSAFIHTLRFGNHFRKAAGATSYLSFTNIRAGMNSSIQIPLMHKHDAGQRSHYLTIDFSISDAPGADEIIIALGVANGGRPHHRIGNRYQDIEEMKTSGEDIIVDDSK